MKNSYNQRLFDNPLRKIIHLARFYWLRKVCKKFSPNYINVLELGCHDARSLIFLPHPPLKYLGLDADWEGGLKRAKKIYDDIEQYDFIKIKKLKDLNKVKESFDIVICLETLEHLPHDELNEYLLKLSFLMKNYLFISVPNEIGIIFLLKFFFKKCFKMQPDNYSFMEIINQFIGRVKKVNRNNHKGFSWLELIKILKKYFHIISLEGIPFTYLPKSLNFGIGIVLKKKT